MKMKAGILNRSARLLLDQFASIVIALLASALAASAEEISAQTQAVLRAPRTISSQNACIPCGMNVAPVTR
jgi:nitrous oxide reductase accessory protein NosL